MDDRETLVEEARRDGVVFFRHFVDAGLAERARQELSPWFDEDAQERKRQGSGGVPFTGSAGYSTLTESTHILTDVYGKSPALDRIMEKVLTDPVSSYVLERMAGKHMKLRGYNVRLMTGKHDPAPAYPAGTAIPHEWHRDSPGEMGIGVLLTDVPAGGNGGTAFVPGSHLFPYCPRWNALFSPKIPVQIFGKIYTAFPWLARLGIFSRILGRKKLAGAIESTGKCGDLYFFFNDTWHGRCPNVQGRKTMIVLVGFFPIEFPFPDQVTPPAASILQKLPAHVRAAAAATLPPNKDKSALVYWLLDNQQRLSPFSWFFWAKGERTLAAAIYLPIALSRIALKTALRFLHVIPPETSPASVKPAANPDSKTAKAA